MTKKKVDDLDVIINKALDDYKYAYEDTLRRLFIGKNCLEEFDICSGAEADAAQFYADIIMPEDEKNFSGKYIRQIK